MDDHKLEIAEAVMSASGEANVIFMSNHGFLTYDQNLKEVAAETVRKFLNGGYYKKREHHVY